MNTNSNKIIQRLNRIIGQIEGIKKMIKSEKECTDILIQFKASKSALDSAIKLFSRNEINSCFENKNLLKKEREKDLESILNSLIN